jgi:PAS domain S-box-containing protein
MSKKLIAWWFVFSLTLIAITEWSAYHNMASLLKTGEVARHCLETLSNIYNLDSGILEAESARRGYVITGQPFHLNRFQSATQKVQNLIIQLRSLTSNEPEPHSLLQNLEPLVNQKIAHINRSISLRRQEGLNLDEQIALTEAGKAICGNIQQNLNKLATSEKQQLWTKYAEQEARARRSHLDLLLGTFLSFGILSLVFWFLYREISGRTKAETHLQRANRTLKTLSAGNQAVIRAEDEGWLLQEICRILVADGGYRLAWVGPAGPDQGKAVPPLAISGADDGFVETLSLTGAGGQPGDDPFELAMRTGQPAIVRSIREDQSLAPWQAEALKHGLASVGAFPLKNDGRPWGALLIYASEPDAFDSGEVKLLEELSRNLEYGLEVLRDRTEQRRAEKALQASEAQYRQLVDNLNHGLAILTLGRDFTFVNQKFCELLGYARPEILGHKVTDFLDRPNQEIITEQLNRRERGEKSPYEIEWTRKDGAKIITLITPIPLFDDDGHLQRALAVITDITDRKQAEARALGHLQSLNLLVAGVGKLAKLRDPNAMVREICQLVVDAFDTPLVWLGRVENQGRLSLLNCAGKSANHLQERERGLDDPILSQGPIGEAISTGKAKFINNLSEKGEGGPWAPAALAQGYQALAAFPLLSDHQAFACLNIYSDRPNFFTPERVDLLQAFARIAAAAVENAHLNSKVEKHLRQLQALRQIDLAISSSLDLRITLNVLLDQLTAQLQVDAATVMLLDYHTLALECAAERGFRTKGMGQARVPLGKGCAGTIVVELKSLYIPDLAAVQEECTRHPLFFSEGFVSYYGVPLLNRGKIKGVIEIFHRTRFDADKDRLEFLEALAGQAAIAIDNATLFEELQRSHMELTLAYEATLEGWAQALELRDFETKGHSQRVTELAVKLARALGVEDKDLAHIYRGALLHDVGKIAVPDHILLKPGTLTPEEWVIMRQHPIFAYELLSPIAYLRPALDIPLCHHERWDGTGYPKGLKNGDIPLAARVFAVVDVWDALSTDRPYRPAWTPDKVKTYLRRQAGVQFDPQVVQVFLEKFLSQTETAA